MAEYSDGDASYARRIVKGLLDVEAREAVKPDGALIISDLEADATEFTADLEVLKQVNLEVPAVRLEGEEPIPIALSLILGTGVPLYYGRHAVPIRFLDHPFYYKWLRDYIGFFTKQYRDGAYTLIAPEQARATFLTRATKFLTTRIAAVREFEGDEPRRWSAVSFLNIAQTVGGSRVSTPGCNFTVSTNSAGLRVFWSGAYRISPNYFSHPTTPVVGVLQSGNYVFGVDGGAYGNFVQWDHNAVVTLPGNPHIHLNF